MPVGMGLGLGMGMNAGPGIMAPTMKQPQMMMGGGGMGRPQPPPPPGMPPGGGAMGLGMSSGAGMMGMGLGGMDQMSIMQQQQQQMLLLQQQIAMERQQVMEAAGMAGGLGLGGGVPMMTGMPMMQPGMGNAARAAQQQSQHQGGQQGPRANGHQHEQQQYSRGRGRGRGGWVGSRSGTPTHPPALAVDDMHQGGASRQPGPQAGDAAGGKSWHREGTAPKEEVGLEAERASTAPDPEERKRLEEVRPLNWCTACVYHAVGCGPTFTGLFFKMHYAGMTPNLPLITHPVGIVLWRHRRRSR